MIHFPKCFMRTKRSGRGIRGVSFCASSGALYCYRNKFSSQLLIYCSPLYCTACFSNTNPPLLVRFQIFTRLHFTGCQDSGGRWVKNVYTKFQNCWMGWDMLRVLTGQKVFTLCFFLNFHPQFVCNFLSK